MAKNGDLTHDERIAAAAERFLYWDLSAQGATKEYIEEVLLEYFPAPPDDPAAASAAMDVSLAKIVAKIVASEPKVEPWMRNAAIGIVRYMLDNMNGTAAQQRPMATEFSEIIASHAPAPQPVSGAAELAAEMRAYADGMTTDDDAFVALLHKWADAVAALPAVDVAASDKAPVGDQKEE